MRSLVFVLCVLSTANACGHASPAAPSSSAPAQPPDPTPTAVPEPPAPPYLAEGCWHGEHDVRSWKRVEPTTVTHGQRLALNHSPCTWSVSLQDGVPLATAHTQERPRVPPGLHLVKQLGEPRVVQQARSGVLVGYNRGEWGGALLWYAHDGSLRRRLLDNHVVAILPIADRFVVFVGLSHRGADYGQAIELLDGAAGFEILRRTELGSAPHVAVMQADGTFLIVTTRALLRLTPDFHVHRVIDSEWRMLHPVSLVVDHAGKAHVGMRGIVAEVDLTSVPPTETWLFPR